MGKVALCSEQLTIFILIPMHLTMHCKRRTERSFSQLLDKKRFIKFCEILRVDTLEGYAWASQ